MTCPTFTLLMSRVIDAIDQFGRVFAGDQVFVERRDVDQRSGVADGVVLVLVMHLVDADRVVAGPLAVVQALAKRKSSFVKCGSYWQLVLLGHRDVAELRLYWADYMGFTSSRQCLQTKPILPGRMAFHSRTLMSSLQKVMLSWSILQSGL
jgi:hypothetical protein